MANLLKTSVAEYGLTAMIKRLGGDCTPTQFMREFAMNSIEAVQRTQNGGNIFVDVNWPLFDQLETHKICFIDNGDGMTGEEMLEHLNNLSSSGTMSNAYENYGMGAKIAALTRNHEGIIYDSWKNGIGNRVVIYYDNEACAYGAKPFELNDGETAWFLPLDDNAKPDIIEEHGTRVTLLGMELDQDTLVPPKDAKGGRENWLYQYLNTRFFEIPEGIEIQARIGYYRDPENKRHNYTRVVKGQKGTLDSYAETRGTVTISDARIHWWILNPKPSGHGREYVTGHTGCINQNELFDLADGRSNRAPGFGIIFGREQIVLYVEPKSGYVQDTTRTRLRRSDGSELPWNRWQDEFRANMPTEIEAFMQKCMNAAENKSHGESIRERLKNIRNFFKISRYKKHIHGVETLDPMSETKGKTGSGQTNNHSSGGRRMNGGGSGAGTLEEILYAARKIDGERAEAVSPDQFPEVRWVSIEDGSRDADDLDDRAAEYYEADNIIVANADFQGMTDLINHFCHLYEDVPEAESIIKDEVQAAIEQQLVEVVMGALSFRNRPKWNPDQFAAAVSQEALTAAVMPRYHILNQIKRSTGSRLGKVTK